MDPNDGATGVVMASEQVADQVTHEVTVNGAPCALTAIDPSTNALDWLREQGLTGAKEGCAEGECGACSVMVARPDEAGGTQWTAINACLVPVAALDGQEVVTAEGLGTPDALHPVQREMAVRGGSQCGYCTPGFVCSMAAEFYREGRGATSRPGRRTAAPRPRSSSAVTGTGPPTTSTGPTASTSTRSPATCAGAPATARSATPPTRWRPPGDGTRSPRGWASAPPGRRASTRVDR